MRDTIGRFAVITAHTAEYRVDLEEPVYDDTFTPRADFLPPATDPGRLAPRAMVLPGPFRAFPVVAPGAWLYLRAFFVS